MSGLTFQATSVAADAPKIDAGIYDAVLDGIEGKRIKGGEYTKDTENGDPKFEWTFTLMEDGAVLYDEGDPVVIAGLTSTSTNPHSKTTPKALRYLKALMTPAEFEDFLSGEAFDAEALIDRPVQVEVTIKDNGWPTIVNVLPARRSRRTAAAE